MENKKLKLGELEELENRETTLTNDIKNAFVQIAKKTEFYVIIIDIYVINLDYPTHNSLS